jgi:hypothetical protein
MVPLVVAKPWPTVPCMIQRRSRLTFTSRWLLQRISACIYGAPMYQMPLPKQKIQTRCVICLVTQFSWIGGNGRIRAYLCLHISLFWSLIILRGTLKYRAFGPLDSMTSSSHSSSKPRHVHHVSTMAHSTMMSSYAFSSLRTYPPCVPLSKRTSFCVTSLT